MSSMYRLYRAGTVPVYCSLCKNNYVFTMDVKSPYTTIPNRDGLLALAHFLDKRPTLQPPTHTLVRLAELVLTLNTFSFNGKFYKQTGGVAMGSRLGPNYACFFMGNIEEQIFEQYTRTVPAKLIFKHRTLHPGGLNTDFHFILKLSNRRAQVTSRNNLNQFKFKVI